MPRGRAAPKSVAALAFAAVACGAAAQDFDPATMDIARFIACDAEAPDYNGFAMSAATDPAIFEALGWAEIAGDNPFLREFRLPGPVRVFGRDVSIIALTVTGPMAVIEGVDPRVLARELSVAPVVDTAGKFLGERVVAESEEKEGDLTIATRVSLNVATVDSHPGSVLAGCSYAVEVR